MVRYALIMILVGFILLSTSALAAFDINYDITDDAIYPDEVAEFQVTILNKEDIADSYNVYSIDPSWIIETEPVPVNAEPNSVTRFNVKIRPNKGVSTGPHLLPVTFKSIEAPTTEQLSFFIYLKSYTSENLEYAPSIALSTRIPNQIDPRDPVDFAVILRNRNALDIKSLDIEISSELFYKKYTIPLGPLEEKSNEVLFEMDELAFPGTYEVTVIISRNNKSISQSTKTFTIIDYSKIVEESYTVNELFKSTEIITVKNVGNEEKEGFVSTERNFFQRIFVSTEPAMNLEDVDGVLVYTRGVKLDPQEEYQFVVVENYRFLASLIIIIILIIVGYFLFRSPLVTVKRAKFFGSREEGMSFVKIKVFMKNRTKRPVYNIKVIDKVPRMAKVVEDHDVLGTLKPSKIVRHERAGTIVRWDIEKLDPFEERIITYKIRSHLKIVGSIKLDSVKLKFDTGLGKERSTYSNSIIIDAEYVRTSNPEIEKDRARFRKR